MSCNGCRVLRKGCSENCILRSCLQWIETPEAQGHATIFVAKFFGRAGLMSFISAVPEIQRPGLFESLLYEAVGRTVNPVNGVVGLLWTGNWQVCQAAVETVFRGGTLRPIPEFLGMTPPFNEAPEYVRLKMQKRCRHSSDEVEEAKEFQLTDLDFSLSTSPGFQIQMVYSASTEKQQMGSPSMNSEESVVTTMCFEDQPKLLSLFN
ncbi:hypothetical protein RND71_034231 [Anisodus tanguticus]|uniref:LOB domain-containing protein n=1 Tax=Anisodus tanguticus TaxID=243964 RepID=A0AAE1RBR2_9SOLA|nr:hypothetical protein RND71_034231 [Anisodus tanguticus]